MAELLDNVMAAFAMAGLAGLFALAVGERLMPLLPSHAMLVLAGLGAAQGAWSFGAALAVTAFGSLVGAGFVHAIAARLGVRRWRSIATRCGLSVARFDALACEFSMHRMQLTLAWQTVPGIRLIGPAVAGALDMPRRDFLLAAAPGVLLWNTVFLGLGALGARLAPQAHLGTLALQLLLALFAMQALAWLAWRRFKPASAARAATR